MTLFLLGAGRHPADRRLHREVRGLPGGHRGRCLAAGRGGAAGQRGGGLLLPAGHRAHVLLAAGGRRSRPSACPGLPTTMVLAVTAAATLALGIVPGSVLELAERRLSSSVDDRSPRRQRRGGNRRHPALAPALHAGVDDRPLAARGRARASPLAEGLARVEAALTDRGRQRAPVRPRGGRPPDGRGRQAVPADAGAAGRPARRRRAPPR